MSTAESKVELQASIPYQTLNDTLDILRTVGDEAILRIGADGLEVSLVDPANVAMHHVELSSSAFDIAPKGSFPIGVNLNRLQDVIGKASNDQSIALGYKAETRKLNISYSNVSVDLACIDPDSIRQEPDVNELDLPNQFVVESEDFEDAVEMADMMSDHVVIECDPDGEVAIIAEGDTDDVTVTLDHDDLLPGSSITEEAVSMFSVAYLYGKGKKKANILGDIPDTELEVHVGDEFPMMMYFDFAGGDGSVETLFAPRIQGE